MDETVASRARRFRIQAVGFSAGQQPTSETPCQVCSWDGDLAWFARIPQNTTLDHSRVWSAEPGCAFCALRQRAAEAASDNDQTRKIHINHGSSNDLPGLVLVHGDTKRQSLKTFISHREAMVSSHDQAMMSPRRCRIIPGDTASEASLVFAEEQIRLCFTSHASCRSPNDRFRPTRLLGVAPINEAGDIRLHGPEDAILDMRYVALSYCWGKVVPKCRLTSSSLMSMKDCIHWSSLPKTMQDAIDYTRRLQIPYVWIDALCITQDSHEDWSREAAMMFDVYQNSVVTLAGLHGCDSECGLYSTSEEVQFKLMSLQVDEQLYDIFAFWGDDHPLLDLHQSRSHPWIDRSFLTPLLQRGWCFQERILSQRIIYFGAHELLWECHTVGSCECGELSLTSKKNQLLKHVFALAQTAPVNSERQEDSWRSLVCCFSRTKLSISQDRLIALNGVARAFSRGEKLGHNYLIGLWSGSLIQDLSWISEGIQQPTARDDLQVAEQGRMDTDIASTWSWASVQSSVTWSSRRIPWDARLLEPFASSNTWDKTFHNHNPFVIQGSGLWIELQAHVIAGSLEEVHMGGELCVLHAYNSRIMAFFYPDNRPGTWDALFEKYETGGMLGLPDNTGEQPTTGMASRTYWRLRNIYIIPLGRWGKDKNTVVNSVMNALVCQISSGDMSQTSYKRIGLTRIYCHLLPDDMQCIYATKGQTTIRLV